jgi:hypothetical protein
VLAQELDLVEAMRRHVVAAVSSLLLKTSPHRFHTEFSTAPDGLPSVQRQLQDAVHEALEKQFRLDRIETVIRMGENDLTRRLKSLARGLHQAPQIDFTVTDERGAGEAFRMLAQYTANGISGDDPSAYFLYEARAFQTTQDEIDAINTIINTELRRLFTGVDARLLRARNFRTPTYQRKIAAVIRDKVAWELGLAISVSSVMPVETSYEANLRDLGEQAWKARKLQLAKALESDAHTADALLLQKRKLWEMKTNIIEAGEFADARLTEIDGQISEIDRRLAPTDTEIARLKSPAMAKPSEPLAIAAALDRVLDGIVDQDDQAGGLIGNTP